MISRRSSEDCKLNSPIALGDVAVVVPNVSSETSRHLTSIRAGVRKRHPKELEESRLSRIEVVHLGSDTPGSN